MPRRVTQTQVAYAPDVSYDLFAWPVDRELSNEEAVAQIGRRSQAWSLGIGRDRRVEAFVQAWSVDSRGWARPRARCRWSSTSIATGCSWRCHGRMSIA